MRPAKAVDSGAASSAGRATRRGFLRGLAALSAGSLLTAPGLRRAEASLRALEQAAQLPDAEFWARVRAEFMLPDQPAYLNSGTITPVPKPVFYTLVERYRALATDPGAEDDRQPLLAEEVRRKAAAFLTVDADEVALTRSTTEGMNCIAAGLDLKAGDEVLTTFHEHPSGLEPWKLKAKRFGIVVKELRFPVPAEKPGQIVDVFREAITTRTRVFSFSHITYLTGAVLPVKALAALARSRDILSVVDGAHALGMIRLDLHDLGVDYYATSAHKWLAAPTGTGLLYLRRQAQGRVWPASAAEGWDNPTAGARRFDRFSQRAWPLVLALGAALEFQDRIGRDRIESRIRALAARLRRQLQAVDGLTIHTPAAAGLHAGLTSFSLDRFKNHEIGATLLRRHQVRVRSLGGGLNLLRVSTHCHNTEDQITRLVAGLKDVRKQGVLKGQAPE
jgi:isopenicillin-N epimerase